MASRQEGRAERQKALQPEVRPPQAQGSGSGSLDPDPKRRQATQQGASVPWEGDGLPWVLLLPPLGASRPSPPPLQVSREQVQLPRLLVQTRARVCVSVHVCVHMSCLWSLDSH